MRRLVKLKLPRNLNERKIGNHFLLLVFTGNLKGFINLNRGNLKSARKYEILFRWLVEINFQSREKLRFPKLISGFKLDFRTICC